MSQGQGQDQQRVTTCTCNQLIAAAAFSARDPLPRTVVADDVVLDHCMVALVLAAGLGNVDVVNNLAALLGCHAVHVQAIGAVEGERVVPLIHAPGGVWGGM